MLNEEETPPFGSYREALNEITHLKETLLKFSQILDVKTKELQEFETLAYDRGYTEYMGIPAWRYLEGLMRRSGDRFLAQGAQLTAARDEIERLVKKLESLQSPAMRVCDLCIRVFRESYVTQKNGHLYCKECASKE